VEIEPENATCPYQLGLAFLRLSEEDAGIEQLERFLDLAPGSPRAEEVRGFIEYPLRTHPDYAPELELVTASGRELSLVNQRGPRAVSRLLDDVVSTLRESVPWLKSLYEELSGEPFTLLSVSLDRDEAAWIAFVQEKEMTWERYHSHGKEHRDGLPPAAIRDPNVLRHRRSWRHPGSVPWRRSKEPCRGSRRPWRSASRSCGRPEATALA
jgi:hypothetical protein